MERAHPNRRELLIFTGIILWTMVTLQLGVPVLLVISVPLVIGFASLMLIEP